MLKQKPILYSGFEITLGKRIKTRLDSIQSVEVYELEDGACLLLFLNLEEQDVPSERVKNKLLKIFDGQKTYLGLIPDNYDKNSIKSVIEWVTAPHGLDCVGGMLELKNILLSDVIHPALNPEKYTKFKLTLPNGILLYGPPGCGKTFIIRKLAEELSYFFVELEHSSVASPYIHETTRLISQAFELAKAKKPALLFIDELEGLVPKRDGLQAGMQFKQEEVNEFLIQLNDAGKSGVLVAGATNRPHLIDQAVLRSGRIDKRIFVGPPDKEARKELFKMFLKGRPCSSNLDIEVLADKTELFSCSDIELLVNDAARFAIRKNLNQIEAFLFDDVLDNFNSSITPEEMEYYEQFENFERR